WAVVGAVPGWRLGTVGLPAETRTVMWSPGNASGPPAGSVPITVDSGTELWGSRLNSTASPASTSVCRAFVTVSPVTPGTVTQRADNHHVSPTLANSSPRTTHNATSRLPRRPRRGTPVECGSSVPDGAVGFAGSARVP